MRHRRQKYRCRCNGNVVTAPGSVRLPPWRSLLAELAVEVAINKYLGHAPLERQVRIMEREGLTVTSQTLWDQIEALAGHLEPCYKALRVLGSPVIHADETHWRLMGHEDEKARWWVWCMASEEAVFYQLFGTRSAKVARPVLSGYCGIVLCDGHGAYEALARAGLLKSGVVVGRKNHYGSQSKRGTEVAALFYSLCETAKLVGVEPRAYLLQATHAALQKPGTVPSRTLCA